MDTACLDFSKALSSASHSLLLQKLLCYGLDKGSLGWVGTWLTQGSGQSLLSKLTAWHKGCSQRLILGPALFILQSDREDGIKCSDGALVQFCSNNILVEEADACEGICRKTWISWNRGLMRTL